MRIYIDKQSYAINGNTKGVEVKTAAKVYTVCLHLLAENMAGMSSSVGGSIAKFQHMRLRDLRAYTLGRKDGFKARKSF